MKTPGKPDNLTQTRHGVIWHFSTTPIPSLSHSVRLHCSCPGSWRIGQRITSGVCKELRITRQKLIQVLIEVGLARGRIVGMADSDQELGGSLMEDGRVMMEYSWDLDCINLLAHLGKQQL